MIKFTCNGCDKELEAGIFVELDYYTRRSDGTLGSKRGTYHLCRRCTINLEDVIHVPNKNLG